MCNGNSVSCGIPDYRSYTPTSFLKNGLSQSKDRPSRGVSREKLASESYRAIGGVARNSIANCAIVRHPPQSPYHPPPPNPDKHPRPRQSLHNVNSIHFDPFRSISVRFGPFRAGGGWGWSGVGERGFCKRKEYLTMQKTLVAGLSVVLR